MTAADWLGIPRAVLDEEERTMTARIHAHDVCDKEVDRIPNACVRPPGHDGRCYRLPTYGDL